MVTLVSAAPSLPFCVALHATGLLHYTVHTVQHFFRADRDPSLYWISHSSWQQPILAFSSPQRSVSTVRGMQVSSHLDVAKLALVAPCAPHALVPEPWLLFPPKPLVRPRVAGDASLIGQPCPNAALVTSPTVELPSVVAPTGAARAPAPPTGTRSAFTLCSRFLHSRFAIKLCSRAGEDGASH